MRIPTPTGRTKPVLARRPANARRSIHHSLKSMMSVVSQGDALWFEESMGGHSAYRMKMDTVLAEEESEFQSILVFKNKMFGTVLALAGVVQCTSLDEHIYHEMMAHVPLMSMTQQGRDGLVVAIIGGGDGGVLREVVK